MPIHIYIYIYTPIGIYIYIYIPIYTYIFLYIPTYTYIYIYIPIYTYICLYTYIYIYMSISLSLYIYIYIHICIHVCTYIYIYIYTHIWRCKSILFLSDSTRHTLYTICAVGYAQYIICHTELHHDVRSDTIAMRLPTVFHQPLTGATQLDLNPSN